MKFLTTVLPSFPQISRDVALEEGETFERLGLRLFILLALLLLLLLARSSANMLTDRGAGSDDPSIDGTTVAANDDSGASHDLPVSANEDVAIEIPDGTTLYVPSAFLSYFHDGKESTFGADDLDLQFNAGHGNDSFGGQQSGDSAGGDYPQANGYNGPGGFWPSGFPGQQNTFTNPYGPLFNGGGTGGQGGTFYSPYSLSDYSGGDPPTNPGDGSTDEPGPHLLEQSDPVQAVPEPASLLIFGSGLLSASCLLRRRRRPSEAQEAQGAMKA